MNLFDTHCEIILAQKGIVRTRLIANMIWSSFGSLEVIFADIQSPLRYFGTLQSFSTCFIHHKYSETRYLV